jgi:hypothetical protein
MFIFSVLVTATVMIFAVSVIVMMLSTYRGKLISALKGEAHFAGPPQETVYLMDVRAAREARTARSFSLQRDHPLPLAA